MSRKRETKVRNGVSTGWIAGLTVCILLGVIVVMNMVIIIKGLIHPEMPPSICGVTPLVVQSGSMSGTAEDHIEVGDLIFVKKADTKTLEKGDIISYMRNGIVVTHRIIEIDTGADGGRLFTTKGDANNIEDDAQVAESQVVGIYTSRIGGVGDFAMFLQRPVGMLIFIGVPMCIFIVYDVISRQRESARQSKRTAELEKELEKLREKKSSEDD